MQGKVPETLVFPFQTETVAEGLASILTPKLEIYMRLGQFIPSLAPVFYNPKMKLNRDIAVLALQAFQKSLCRPIRVAEPLAGCGIRGIRFAKEVSNIESVSLNDLNPLASRLIEKNIDQNNLTEKTSVTNFEAKTFLAFYAEPGKRFDVVDVDPFGTPAPFIESALCSLTNKGLLAVTATDTAPLCGVTPKACLRKYYGKPLRTEYCRELGIRLILNAIVLTASKHDLGVKVLLTHATDYYFRIYVQIIRGAQRADFSINQLGYVLHCFHCLYRKLSQGIVQIHDLKCPICGEKMDFAGPLWLGPIIESEFCKETIRGAKGTLETRVLKLLNCLVDESDKPPTFYVLDKVCDKLNLPIPPKKDVLEKLTKMGWTAGGTHFHPSGIKTNASINELREVLLSLEQ